MQAASGIAFRVAPPGYALDWHCAPRGDVVLAEDLTGRGHVARVVGKEPRVYAIVPLAET